MAFPGMKTANLTNLSTTRPHHIDYSSGVGIHVQNPALNRPIVHELQGGFLVQKTDPHPTAQPGAELYGMDYTNQVLQPEIYRNSPHNNLPVMDVGAREFHAVVTPDNAYQNQVLSDNEHKRAVLLGAEVGSNFINPPTLATKGAVAGASLVGVGMLGRSGKGLFDDAPGLLAKLPGIRHLVGATTETAAARYAQWVELSSAGRAFKSALDDMALQSKKAIDQLDGDRIVTDKNYRHEIYQELFSASENIVKANGPTSHEFHDEVQKAVFAMDAEIYGVFKQKLMELGHFVPEPVAAHIKKGAVIDADEFERTLKWVKTLDVWHLTDHLAKVRLLKSNDEFAKLSQRELAEFNVWRNDPDHYYNVLQSGLQPNRRLMLEAAVAEEQFKLGLTRGNFEDRVAALKKERDELKAQIPKAEARAQHWEQVSQAEHEIKSATTVGIEQSLQSAQATVDGLKGLNIPVPAELEAKITELTTAHAKAVGDLMVATPTSRQWYAAQLELDTLQLRHHGLDALDDSRLLTIQEKLPE